MFFVLKPKKNICKPEHREDNSYNIPMGQSKFSYELTFWFISIENSGKQKSKNTLRVEINQFVMVNMIPWSYYAINKMCGVKLPHPLLEE